MNCRELQQLKHASADGELELARALEVETHLRQCPDCARAFENLKRMKSAIAASGLYFKAPTGLAARIRADLPIREQSPSLVPASFNWNWLWLKWATAIGSTALIAALLTAALLTSPSANRLVEEVADSHVRSLMAGHLMDVASTDQHTVKPWFDGKLDFAPPVVDLASNGFPLVGGRLDYLDHRSVAALVFQRQKHFINLFIWPASGNDPGAEKVFVRNGYNLIHWHESGMACWAVSDLNREELAGFAKLYQDHPAPGPR